MIKNYIEYDKNAHFNKSRSIHVVIQEFNEHSLGSILNVIFEYQQQDSTRQIHPMVLLNELQWVQPLS